MKALEEIILPVLAHQRVLNKLNNEKNVILICHGTITSLSHKDVKHLFNLCFIIKYCREPFYSGSGMPRSTIASLTCLTLWVVSCNRPDSTLLGEIRWRENIFVSVEPTTIDACTILKVLPSPQITVNSCCACVCCVGSCKHTSSLFNWRATRITPHKHEYININRTKSEPQRELCAEAGNEKNWKVTRVNNVTGSSHRYWKGHGNFPFQATRVLWSRLSIKRVLWSLWEYAVPRLLRQRI